MLDASNSNAQNISIDSIITEKKLKEVVYEIANDNLEGRLANSPGCTKAAAYIARRMETAGLQKLKAMDGYFQNLDSNFKNVKNVVGALRGKSRRDEIIIISAHYDHLGRAEPSDINFRNDKIFNGANDDASGVAVMLALANYFATKQVERTILFVAFSGEEIGLKGSFGFSNTIMPNKIITQINLEMLGRRDIHQTPFITGYWYSNFRDLLNKTLADSTGAKDYFEKDSNKGSIYFQRSDNFPMAELGIPAHTIMLSTENDRYYHTVGDEPYTLDYKMMTSITKNIALAIEPMVQGSITPKRIDTHIIQADKKPFFD